MKEPEMRTHIVLPDELVKEIDNFVSKRKRSRFIEEAVKEKLKREALLNALGETAGTLSAEEHHEWETEEEVAAWVRESRPEASGLMGLQRG
jgi:metal-responsive CopG/Arc/MetJ family transcriptional regulator